MHWKSFLVLAPRSSPDPDLSPLHTLKTQLKSAANRRHGERGWRLAHGLCHWVCPPSDGHAQWDEPLDGLTPSFNFTPRTIHKYPKTQHTLGSFEILKTKKKIRSGRLSLFCRRPRAMSTFTFYEGSRPRPKRQYLPNHGNDEIMAKTTSKQPKASAPNKPCLLYTSPSPRDS